MDVNRVLEEAARAGVTAGRGLSYEPAELHLIDDDEQTPEEHYRELERSADEWLENADVDPLSLDVYRDSASSSVLHVLVFEPNWNRMRASTDIDLDRVDETQLQAALASILSEGRRELGIQFTRYEDLVTEFGEHDGLWDKMQSLSHRYAEYRQLVDVAGMTPRDAFDRVQQRAVNRQRRGNQTPAQLAALAERTLLAELSDDHFSIELVSVAGTSGIFQIIDSTSGTGRKFIVHLDDDQDDIGPEFDFACSELRAYLDISEMLQVRC